MKGKVFSWLRLNWKAILVGGIVVLVIVSQTTRTQMSSVSYPTNGVSSTDSYSEYGESAPSYQGSVDMSKVESQKIYNGEVYLDTVKFDSVYEGVRSLVEEYNGYTETDSIDYNSYSFDGNSYRTAFITVRVPGTKFEDFAEDLSNISDAVTVSKSIQSQSVSDVYSSLNSKLTAAKSNLERLNLLYESAVSVTDKINLLTEINDTETEIENLSTSIKYYDESMTYSSMNIYLKETNSLSLSTQDAGYFNKLVESLKLGWNSGLEFFGGILLMLAKLWLIILVFVVVILVGRKVYKIRHKH